MTLNCEVVVWVGPELSVAPRARCTVEERLASVIALTGLDVGMAWCGGFFPPGTPVHDVVDLGESNRVECTIGGHRVITVKSFLN